MNMQCMICNKNFEIGRLQIHLSKIHKIDLEEYYIKYVNPNASKICSVCGNPKKFTGFKNGYSITCGNKTCRAIYINETYKENQRIGCIKRNKKWKEEIVDGKTRQQLIVESGSELRKIKQEDTSIKISNTLKEKDSNGYTCIARSFMKKYGEEVTNPMHIPQNVLKIRKTFKERYGVDWITQSENIKETIRNTIFDNYGVFNYSQSQESKDNMSVRYKDTTITKILKYFESNNLSIISDLRDIYQNEKTLLKYKCNLCNTEYRKCWNDIQSWWMCRKCNPYSNSSYENELEIYLSQYNIAFLRKQKIIKNPITGRMLELDFYFPNLGIAIEFDGLYWHCNENQLNDNYHLMKTELCEKQGIKLIHIFEDEWILKKNIVLSRISNLLRLPNLKRIHGRKCTVRTIDSAIKNKFLLENHIQGGDTACINLGLFYEEKLVSLMTFSRGSISKGHIQKDGCYELSRFSNICFHTIPGAASKLLSHFKKNYSWKEIFSYADRRWSNGNVYHKLEFKLVSAGIPNYWYMNKLNMLKRIHRFSFRKSIVVKMDGYNDQISIQDNMKNMGYCWIYDCGNYKFLMTK
jgi:hypothetical protein